MTGGSTGGADRPRTALVTGAGSGIGRATAVLLARGGYLVALAGRRADPLRETRELAGGGRVGCIVCGDHAVEADAERMIGQAVGALGHLDVLVNNAGAIRRNVPVHELSTQQWDDQIAVNLRGPFLMARQALRAMLADAGGGDRVIVNVSSTLAHTASPGVAAYSAAKAGVLALTRSIAVEYGERGIRCNAVCPHVVDTPLAAVDRPNWTQQRTEFAHAYPLGRIGAADDVAAAVVYLASPDASWVTGVVLDVDGGFSAR